MDFLVGIHTKDYRGTYNIQGKLIFVITGIKVLTLPEMTFYDIMFEDYNDYSNEDLYSLLDSINGWKYSSRIYREKDILYVNYGYCNCINLGAVSLYNYVDFIPLFCNGNLVNKTADKLRITQFSNVSLLNITIFVNLTSYKVGIFADGRYIFGDIKFKSLHYDYEGFYKEMDEYTKSFLEIHSVSDPYFINNIVPIDYEDNKLLLIGNRCILNVDTIHTDKIIIIHNGVKELILIGLRDNINNKVILVIPPSIDRLFIDSDSYLDINIKFTFAKKSNIHSILYYLYKCAYYIPKDLRDKLESKLDSGCNLSYRDKMLNYIKDNKDDMVSLLGKSGLSVSFYGD